MTNIQSYLLTDDPGDYPNPDDEEPDVDENRSITDDTDDFFNPDADYVKFMADRNDGGMDAEEMRSAGYDGKYRMNNTFKTC